MKKLLIMGFFAMCMTAVFAQGDMDDMSDGDGHFTGVDGIAPSVITQEKEIIPYDDIREADIMWSKRVWRIIDVREKMNLPLAYPQLPLIKVIHEAAMAGEVEAYDNTVLNSDQFKMLLPPDKVSGIGSSTDTVWQINPITLRDTQVIISNELTWEKIVKYRIKEDWFFDEESSTFQVRIIGIAPVMESYDAQGNYRGDETMYWIYYPDLRRILAKDESYNVQNDAINLSFEDIFEGRFFSSYIYKESNVYDRVIQSYATGLDALFESDRIKQDMFEYEHDLWVY
ncbi:MAG: gliding motility protein GldN [Chitinophagales bacterium]